MLTAFGNYYLDQKEIHDHLDTLMATSALFYDALLTEDLSSEQLKKIQTSLNNIGAKTQEYYKQYYIANPPEKLSGQFNLQILDKNNEILLHSPFAIPIAPQKKTGFSNRWAQNTRWRIFSSYNPDTGKKIIIADRYDARNVLGRQITEDDLYIMFVTFPLSGLLIWIIISRGLDSLEKITQEVAHRAPHHLDPVDLTNVPQEIKPLIDELNKLFAKLQQAFDREKRFAADAAHELRTPLAALKTQAQVALKTVDPDERQLALHNVIVGVNRSAHVVQQLLTISRLAPGVGGMEELTDLNLSKLTAEVIAMLAPEAIQKQIEIDLESSPKNALLHGNRTALSILMRNLIDNAIRYTANKGTIHVFITQTAENTVFSVVDNGPGIPGSLRTRVFERFFRIIGNKSPGSGLGLAIVRQIAELHGASITLNTPDSGIGLKVDVIFPVIPA